MTGHAGASPCSLPALSLALLAGCAHAVDDEPRLQQVELPTCADPVAAHGALDDGMPGAGIDFVHSLAGLDPDSTRLDQHSAELSAGVVAADLDGDQQVDLFLPQAVGPNALYWGVGEASFEAAAPGHGAELPDVISQGGSTADFDGDGLLDLLVLGRDSLSLLHNTGQRSFVDRTEEMGLSAAPGTSAVSAWADFDRDGDLDLFVGNYGRTTLPMAEDNPWNSLWRNDGDRFTDIGETLGRSLQYPGATLHATWRDFDYDGDPDLLVLNDRGSVLTHSLMLENLGADDQQDWLWQDRISESGMGILRNPMGASVIDLNGDGLRDLWFSAIGGTQAFRAEGPWQFVDVSQHWSVDLSSWEDSISWAVVDLDLAGNGDPGILLTYGPLAHDEEDSTIDLWLNQADRFLGHGRDEAGESSFAAADEVFPVDTHGNSRGVARADLNHDGVPDVVIGRIEASPLVLLGHCTEARRLVVNLRDPGSTNHFAIGALVTVTAGGRSQIREVSADGPGPFSASDPALLFGLGDAEQVDALTIRWPDGRHETFTQLCAHCRITVSAPSR